jgi:hypothetical protein
MIIHRSGYLVGSVACLTVVYVALVVMAAGCVSMPVSASEGHDHHSQDSTHSSLCAWSCQMMSQSGPVASVPTVVVGFVAVPVTAPSVDSHSASLPTLRPSRAPPVFPLG